jgi:hypothetical protein
MLLQKQKQWRRRQHKKSVRVWECKNVSKLCTAYALVLFTYTLTFSHSIFYGANNEIQC